jgi:uncharacterized membrane protein
VSVGRFSLERAIESALTLGLLASGALLVLGLTGGSEAALRLGIITLMLTPVARVLILAIGLIHARDWTFAAVSLFVLSVLAAGILLGSRL